MQDSNKVDNLLSALKLDKEYQTAAGCHMHYVDGQEEVEVLDLVGGYGALFLGHNHSELKEYAISLLRSNTPSHSQLSRKRYASALEEFCNSEINNQGIPGSYRITLLNSGSEATEAALKHARYEFGVKKGKLQNDIIKELNIIENFFAKTDTTFDVTFCGQTFSEFDEFRAYVKSEIAEPLAGFEPKVLAAERSFHGKTTGALDITHNDKFRGPFQNSESAKSNCVFFKLDDSSIDHALESLSRTVRIPRLNATGDVKVEEKTLNLALCIIVEPIQGEAGVHLVSSDKLRQIRGLATMHQVPLIFDEIQCGSYRTGPFLYSAHLRVAGDYYLLSKSMSGGLCKISALLIDTERYEEEFGILHTSTFGSDDLSSAIALRALNISKRQAPRVQEVQRKLSDGLNELKGQFPGVVKEVRGAGLIWAIEFESHDLSGSFCFQLFSRSGMIGYLYSSYLLNVWNIRMAPTLSNVNTLRIQPSVLVVDRDLSKLHDGLKSLCDVLEKKDFYKLIEHLLPPEDRYLRQRRSFSKPDVTHASEDGTANVGFLMHLIDEETLKLNDPSLQVVPNSTLRELLALMEDIAVPVRIGSKVISSEHNKVRINFIGLPITATRIIDLMRQNDQSNLVRLCNDGVSLAKKECNCDTVGLGQYTSIVTNNGKLIHHPNVAVTTGNSFTVGIGFKAILDGLSTSRMAGVSVGLVGANGNISSTYVSLLLPYCSKLILVGRDHKHSMAKIERSVKQILFKYVKRLMVAPPSTTIHEDSIAYKIANSEYLQKSMPEGNITSPSAVYNQLRNELGEEWPIEVTTDLNKLRECEATIVATSSPNPFLNSAYFRPGSLVYDISVPTNCTEELIDNPEVTVMMGGIVQLPNNEKLPVKGLSLARGEAFACIAETLLLGLEGVRTNFSLGALTDHQVHLILQIAERHNFSLKKPKVLELA